MKIVLFFALAVLSVIFLANVNTYIRVALKLHQKDSFDWAMAGLLTAIWVLIVILWHL